MKASDLFAQALEAEGVEFIFGIPGEELRACLESPGVHLIEIPVDYSGNGRLLNDDLVCPL